MLSFVIFLKNYGTKVILFFIFLLIHDMIFIINFQESSIFTFESLNQTYFLAQKTNSSILFLIFAQNSFLNTKSK